MLVLGKNNLIFPDLKTAVSTFSLMQVHSPVLPSCDRNGPLSWIRRTSSTRAGRKTAGVQVFSADIQRDPIIFSLQQVIFYGRQQFCANSSTLVSRFYSNP